MKIENPVTRNTDLAHIATIFSSQQRHQFEVARTTAAQRIRKLKKLYNAILSRQDAIQSAIFADFQRPAVESDISELGVILGDIRYTIAHLKSWMHLRHAASTMTLFGTASEIMVEPKGVCLIISPWNFPFNLTFSPLVSAVAAGNCVVLKPSEFVPNSVAVMREIVEECFSPEEVALVEGNAEVSQNLLELPFNHVFFTGSPAVGKLVMAAAAKNLCSVTLELGGKSPVVVDDSADLEMAAAKVVWLKNFNAGQTCIAPDYVLVDAKVKSKFLEKCREKIHQFYGTTPENRKNSPDLCRSVNHRHFDRVCHLLEDAVLKGAHVFEGGSHDRTTRFIEPTILTSVPEDAQIFSEEIFGPLLPVFEFQTLETALKTINRRQKPLAVYIFSKNKRNIATILSETRGGGVAINDVGLQFYNPNLPFGGSNNSGIGTAHGEFGFLEFSTRRGVVRQNTIFPLTNLFLPPYNKNRIAKWLLEGVVRWF